MPMKIRDLINEIPINYGLPKFQRKYVWDQERVTKLVDSVFRGYNLGMIYIWKNDESILSPTTSDWKYNSDSKISSWILDGQQRLRSLYLLFSNVEQLEKTSIHNVDNTSSLFSPRIFPKRATISNKIRNKSNSIIDMDYFLDLHLIDINKLRTHIDEGNVIEAIEEDIWMPLREIEKESKLALRSSEVAEIKLLTDYFDDPADNEAKITIATFSKIKNKYNWKVETYNVKEFTTSNQIRYISLSLIDVFDNIFSDCKDHFNWEWKDNKAVSIREMQDFFKKLRDNYRDATIIRYEFTENFENLTHLFSRINSTPLLLDAFDLLVALTYREGDSKKPKIDLRESIDKCFNYSWINGFFNELTIFETRFIETVALICDKKSMTDKDILKINREDLVNLDIYEDKIPSVISTNTTSSHMLLEKIKNTIDFLESDLKIQRYKDFKYTRMIPILFALFYKYYEEAKCPPNFKAFLKDWIFREFIDNYFHHGGSKPYNRYKKIIELMDKANGSPIDIESLKKKASIEIDSDDFSEKITEKSMKLMIFNNCEKLIDFDLNTVLTPLNSQAHHIFPKLGKKKPERNIGINFTYLKPRTNNSDISDRDPRDYLDEMLFSSGLNDREISKHLKNHFLPSKSWWLNESTKNKSGKFKKSEDKVFEDFIKERLKLIVKFKIN